MHSSSYFPTREAIYATAVARVPARLPARCFVTVCSKPSAPFLGLAIISRRIGMPGALSNGDAASSSSASSAELPDVSPESLPEGGCSHCASALRSFELCWGSGQCNRCYNKGKGGPRCYGCQKGLWKCELNFPSGYCCECFPLNCAECRRQLTVVEVRWGNHCCDLCYNRWKKHTPPCKSCWYGLLLPEMKGGSMLCQPCRARARF